MYRLLAKTLLVCLLGYGASLPASAEEPANTATGVVLSSGVEGGGYWSAATRLQDVAAAEMGLAVQNLPSTGSLENIEKLLDAGSPVNLAFMQADAAQYYLNQHPGQQKKLDLLENIGQECVFILTSVDSEVRTDEDMRAQSGLRLGIPSATSGAAVTFNYMASQMPDLAGIKVIYGNTLAALGHLNGPDATVDAVMVVHRPKEHSAEVDYALANPDRFRFVELSDERLTGKLWNDRKIYQTMTLALPGAAKPVKTICVPGLLVVNKEKLALDAHNKLSELANYHWMKVYVTE